MLFKSLLSSRTLLKNLHKHIQTVQTNWWREFRNFPSLLSQSGIYFKHSCPRILQSWCLNEKSFPYFNGFKFFSIIFFLFFPKGKGVGKPKYNFFNPFTIPKNRTLVLVEGTTALQPTQPRPWG